MKKFYVKIEGMTCDHCKSKITNELKKINGIKSITFDGHIAEIEYSGKTQKEKVVEAILRLDYYTDLKMISDNNKNLKRTISFFEIAYIGVIIITISIVLNIIFGFNIFNVIPKIDSKITYTMLFLTGLLTSIHCVSMCGAINLIASCSINRNIRKPILYNLGRLISYTIIGGMVGLLGSTFSINIHVQSSIIIVAAVFMFLMALNLAGVTNFSIKIRKNRFFGKVRGSFMLGILNGLMPCGPLQAMQVYALSTGSFIYGALSMFLFCLGTIPLMLFMGMISNFLNNKNRKILNKVSIVLILILSIAMFNRGLLGMGLDISNVFKANYDNYLKSEIKEEYQVVEFDLTYSGYKDIVVQKGIPVKMIINVSKNALTGCNNSLIINEFGIKKDLEVGKNEIIFTPSKTGNFTYTCWMGMIKNKILVIEGDVSDGG